MNLDQATIRSLPKVLLHDHLDGGVRPATVLEIADQVGHELPVSGDDRTAEGLATWFRESADSGSLVRYLETFAHTVGVMQTAPALRRVARESVLDLARDGVVYAESRYAPEQHLEGGLSLEQVIEEVDAGFREGEEQAASEGHPIVVRSLLTAMRHAAKSREIAELAVRYRDRGVAGFDIAGAEAGHPPSRHLDAFEYLRRENAHFTIHAGEAFGLPSIWEAVQLCGAERLGHGVRIVEDIDVSGPRPVLGRLAAYVRDARIALELAPTSNLQTGIATTMAEHPIGLLFDLGFRVTVNCDNRLMSNTTLSKEFAALHEAFGWGPEEMRRCAISAMHSAFWDHQERERIITEVIRPAYLTAS